jgi:formate dehydrogenase subunit gamma
MSRFCPGAGIAARLAALLVAVLLISGVPALAQEQDPAAAHPIMVPNPAADLWRAVRQREAPAAGSTQVEGVQTGVLIDRRGEDFRNYRRQDFISGAALVLGGFAGAVLLFFLLRGRIRVPGGRSGKSVLRFTDFERTVHWLAAILFIFLALTGLTLLFGRFVVLPVFGAEAFSLIASASKEGHNLFGPLFLVSLILLFICFATRNMPARGDLRWLAKGGGIIGSQHLSAGFFNALEKIWFWAVIVLGLVCSISGLVLLFPVFGQGREIMQLALIIHGIAAVLFIGGSFGHIYIGTIGTEDSLESMTTGYVDENWARAHHDRWLAELQQQAGSVKHAHAQSPSKVDIQGAPDKA